MLRAHNPTKIAALNDAARKSFSGCRVYMTPGVQALYQTQAIAARVQAYDDFNERNDPYGEHDFGSFEFCGETIFWKIEYYDLDFQMHSLDKNASTFYIRIQCFVGAKIRCVKKCVTVIRRSCAQPPLPAF